MTHSFGVTGGGVQQHPVAVQEVLEAASDWKSKLPDVDGVHHGEALQLVHAQIPVKHLEENRSRCCSRQHPSSFQPSRYQEKK